MSVKLRLARIGKKHVPYYRIVAIDSRKKRDAAHLEDLGTFDSLKSTVISLNQTGIESWLQKGAQMTNSVKKIYKKHTKKVEGTPESQVKKASTKKEKGATEEVTAE